MRRGLISVAIFAAFVVIFTLSRHAIDTSTTTTTTARSTTTTTLAASTTTTTTTLASSTCSGSSFSGTYNEGQGAAGTIYASVTLTKTTPGSCTVDGWPLVTLQDKLGGVVTLTPIDVPQAGNDFQFLTGTASDLTSAANRAPSSLTLTQSQSVTFALAYSDVPVGTQACGNGVSMSVQFAVDGATVGLTPPSPIQPCDTGQIWLSPFYATS
ncbi:MAG TPA: DUF4232 domain-containing protein [Acidimicrobiales bacterium]|nr:DUF4232 domain-containing protein [Acidimicrobiales bacterium]